MWQGLEKAINEVENFSYFIEQVQSGLMPDVYDFFNDMNHDGWAAYQLIYLYLASRIGETYSLPVPDGANDNDIDYNIDVLSDIITDNINVANLEWSSFKVYIDDNDSIQWLKRFVNDSEFEKHCNFENLIGDEVLVFSSLRVGKFLNTHFKYCVGVSPGNPFNYVSCIRIYGLG